jgi:hypothetical protein
MPIAVNPSDGSVAYLADDGSWKPAQTAVNPQTKQMIAHDGKDWVSVPVQKTMQSAPTPIIGYPETYKQVREDAENQVATGMGQLRHAFDPSQPGSAEGAVEALKGAGNTALGAAGYVASPITAAYRNMIGQPVENLTGIPKEYTEFAVSLATPGLGLTKIGSTRTPKFPVSSPGQETVRAADRLSQSGSEVTVPKFIASDSPSVQYTAQGARNVPVGGTPIVQATDNSIAQIGTKADEIAANYGGSSVHGSGTTARQSIVNWIGPESKAAVNTAYDAVDKVVDPRVTTELTNTRAIAQDILSRRANAGIQGDSGAVNKIAEAATRPGGLNYAGIKDLRTNLGEALNGGILPADMSQVEAKQLYGALSQDLTVAVSNAGGAKASALFDRANRYNALVNERREALAKIVGADGNAPAEQVFDRLIGMASGSSRADVTRLAQARKAMEPTEWNDIASAVVGRLGRDVEGNFSPARFVTDYGKLSDAGKSFLFRSGGRSSLASSLDDIATISSRWKDNYQKFGNPSGTAQNLSFAALGAGMTPVLFGHLVEPITAITTVVGSRVISSALAQPATAAAAAQFSRRYQIAAQNPSTSAAVNLTISARNLANTLNDKLGLSIKPDDFLRAIQGPVKGAADDEHPKPEGVRD